MIGARRDREVEDRAALVAGQVGVLHQAVGAGEVDRLGLQVGLALARSTAGVVHGDAGVLLLERLRSRPGRTSFGTSSRSRSASRSPYRPPGSAASRAGRWPVCCNESGSLAKFAPSARPWPSFRTKVRKLLSAGALGGVGLLRVHDDPGRRRDRVRVGAGFVQRAVRQVGGDRRRTDGRGRARQARVDERAGRVLDRRELQVRRLGVAEVDVADGAVRARDDLGDAGVALAGLEARGDGPPPELFELLPQAARTRAGTASATMVRRTRDVRVVAVKGVPFRRWALMSTLRTKGGSPDTGT